jgi:hypothetical protein
VKLTEAQHNSRAQALIAKIQECESECHALGFIRAAHSVNAAKNATGWDYEETVTRALFVARAIRISALDKINMEQAMTDAHQDVAGVVARIAEERKLCAVMGDDTANAFLGEISALIESLSQALSEAEAERDRVKVDCAVMSNSYLARALAAESRLSEAMKVIEPFALIAEHDIGSDEADSDTYQPINCNTVPRISVGHLRAARRFLNAGKE